MFPIPFNYSIIYGITLQGELIADLIVQRSLPVNDIEWHPEKKLLACGWQSGEITIINVGMSEVYEQIQGHISPITTIAWSTNGGHLITSDKVRQYKFLWLYNHR